MSKATAFGTPDYAKRLMSVGFTEPQTVVLMEVRWKFLNGYPWTQQDLDVMQARLKAVGFSERKAVGLLEAYMEACDVKPLTEQDIEAARTESKRDQAGS